VPCRCVSAPPLPLPRLPRPLQWFYNSTTQQLYLWYNGTGSPPDKNQYVVTSELKVLLNISGTQAKPVTGVSFFLLG
jgi:hypothetical protein